jgi:hypothetical protein
MQPSAIAVTAFFLPAAYAGPAPCPCLFSPPPTSAGMNTTWPRRTLGDDVIGKCFHFGTASLEHGHLGGSATTARLTKQGRPGTAKDRGLPR